MSSATAAIVTEIKDHRAKALLDVIRKIGFTNTEFDNVMQQAYAERYEYCHTPKGMEEQIEELESSNNKLRGSLPW